MTHYGLEVQMMFEWKKLGTESFLYFFYGAIIHMSIVNNK